jgi:integrase
LDRESDKMSLNQSTLPKKRKPKVARDRLVLFAGKLFIFTRREYAKPTWHCEIRLPNQPVSIRSTGTTDEEKAKEIAHEWYQETKFAVAQGKDIHSKRASVLLQNYIDYVESIEANNQTRYIKLTYLKRWVSMLGAVQVGQIDAAFVTNLFRQTEMNSKKGSYSPNTHVKMSKYIKSFFKWCKSRGYLKALPEMDQVKPRKSRRPHFDEDAYQRLLQSMPAFKINPNKRVARRRRMLCDYVQILANSGLRPGEHRKLKWENVRYEMSDTTPHVMLSVEGKTGRRAVVADACVGA